MKLYHSWRFVLVLLFAFLLNSCGSGGLTAGGGIGGSGIISQGEIAAFGSIVVNGTRFDTSNATLIVKGEEIGVGDSIVRDNLDIGRVVTVEGPGREDDTNAVADRVIYSNNVEGPVERMGDIDRTTKKLVVLGQTVIINALTKFKGTTFDAINRNDVVEVSGFRDNTGAIRATFLEKIGAFTDSVIVEVNGFVKDLDTDLQTFKINDLTVDYSLADTSGFPGGVPAGGLQVEVEGTLDATGGEMLATKIEPGDELGAEDADEIEVIGFVTNFVTISEFTLGNQVVVVEKGAEIVDGEIADIAPGVKLEAAGTLVDGILYAYKIEFWGPDQIEVEGIVTDIVSGSEFTVGDHFVVTDEETVFEDGDPEDIVLGINLEIKGRLIDGVIFADKVSFIAE
ncbi:MAG: DUF5666 domain-containing protein [Thermodesulfobacteriota bacterium]|nr:DUF5666 domain-containing protein [Thermodesulfobacteriota bacterium]